MQRIVLFVLFALMPISAQAFVSTSRQEEEPPRAAGCQFQVRESYDLWYCFTKPQYEQYLAEKQAYRDQRDADRDAQIHSTAGRATLTGLLALLYVFILVLLLDDEPYPITLWYRIKPWLLTMLAIATAAYIWTF